MVCPSVYLVRFDLPGSTTTLPFSLGKYFNLKATIGGAEVVRSYSPISRPSTVGLVDFLIKVRLTCASHPSQCTCMVTLHALRVCSTSWCMHAPSPCVSVVAVHQCDGTAGAMSHHLVGLKPGDVMEVCFLDTSPRRVFL
jgi:ferredoxin-NADP reductase